MKTEISASVGSGGKNVDLDVETIQKLLNAVPPPIDAPLPFLDEDGDCGQLTIAGIQRFQKKALNFVDGRVEPGKNTHKKLIELAGGQPERLMRKELANSDATGFVSSAFLAAAMLNDCLVPLRELQNDTDASNTQVDNCRLAIGRNFGVGPLDRFDVGKIRAKFEGMRVHLETAELEWFNVTMKQAKLDLNMRVGADVPAIYYGGAFSILKKTMFTPNYRQFDDRNGLGYGPNMLTYELLKGLAYTELGRLPNEGRADVESDEPNYPGARFDLRTTLQNAPSYAAFAFEMRSNGAIVPMGRTTRRL